MQNKAVAEEQRHDHMHIALHFLLPSPESDEVPTFTATSARHINGRLISTGPLFAAAAVDLPIPVVDMDFPEYVYALMATMVTLADANVLQLVHGVGGRIMKARIFPAPPPPEAFLW